MTPEEAVELAKEVLSGHARSHVDAARELARYVVEAPSEIEGLKKRIENGMAAHNEERRARDWLARENERLKEVIRTGGAMYRAERAAMGIPGGIDIDEVLAPRRHKVMNYSFNKAIAEQLCGCECVACNEEPFAHGCGSRECNGPKRWVDDLDAAKTRDTP